MSLSYFTLWLFLRNITVHVLPDLRIGECKNTKARTNNLMPFG